jgi:hypothetical protein
MARPIEPSFAPAPPTERSAPADHGHPLADYDWEARDAALGRARGFIGLTLLVVAFAALAGLTATIALLV